VKEGVRKVKLLRVTGYGLLFLLIVFLDQASKFLVPKLGFEVVFNKGIAFGLFPDFLWVMFLPLVLLAAIVYRSKLHLSLITYHLFLAVVFPIFLTGFGLALFATGSSFRLFPPLIWLTWPLHLGFCFWFTTFSFKRLDKVGESYYY